MTTTAAPARTPRRRFRWRVVDIVVTAVVAVASAVVFSLWDLVYNLPQTALSAVLPGVQGLINGPWLFAGVLAAFIVRKPGAALFAELVAAALEALIGNAWGGLLTLSSGITQGLGAELVLALLLYRVWRPWSAMLAGAGAGLLGAINDTLLYYGAQATPVFVSVYLVTGALSGAVIAGLLSWIVARALARTGALSRFASGREVTADV